MSTWIDIVAINLQFRKVVLADGAWADIINMIDADGKETEDAGEAVAIVVRHEDLFYSVCLDDWDFSPRVLH